MYSRIKHILSYTLLFLGFLTLFFAHIDQLIITSDIPIQFTTAEAQFTHLLLLVSFLLILSGLVLLKHPRTLRLLFITLSLFSVLSISLFFMHKRAEYFTEEYALLIIPFVINPVLLTALIFYCKFRVSRQAIQ